MNIEDIDVEDLDALEQAISKAEAIDRGENPEWAPPTAEQEALQEPSFLASFLDPTTYLTGGAMGAAFAAKLGKPILKTAGEWAGLGLLPLAKGAGKLGVRVLGGKAARTVPKGGRLPYETVTEQLGVEQPRVPLAQYMKSEVLPHKGSSESIARLKARRPTRSIAGLLPPIPLKASGFTKPARDISEVALSDPATMDWLKKLTYFREPNPVVRELLEGYSDIPGGLMRVPSPRRIP